MVEGKPRRRKILYCIDALARGGTELQLAGLIDRLDRSVFEPVLCTLKPSPPELTPADCHHMALDVPRILSPAGLSRMWSLSRYLRREKFSVVQTFFQDATIFGGTAARMAGVPVRLASFRDLGFWRTPRQEMLLRRIHPMMTGFLANSRVVKEHFVQEDRLSPDRIHVIPNGIESGRLPFVDHDGPTINVGIVGNMNRRVKRTDLFIEAAGIVTRIHPQVTWHVVGDGELRKGLENQAAAAGLGDRIIFAGRIADMATYLAKLQVGVMCSDTEGFSNALLEYMFKGCAVVATDVGGNSEALIQGETGLLVPVGDAGGLAGAITKLVEDVPARRRLAQNARQYAESHYNWSRCVAAHEVMYLGRLAQD